jgi:hypothetical protein
MASMTTSPSSRKKPVSQKRVAVVLTSLVGTLTLSAAMLLGLEGGKISGSGPALAAMESQQVSNMLEPAVALRPSAWNYIIVYTSGDSAGDAASLTDGHYRGDAHTAHPATLNRTPANFHFVIEGPGSKQGQSDGQLDVNASWLDQETGAPYAGWPDSRYHSYTSYKNAVGVCCIGDVNQQTISPAQVQTLTQLVSELQRKLGMPRAGVLFQWELVPNAAHATVAQKQFAQAFRQQLN